MGRIVRTKVFASGNSVAVRLPRGFAIPAGTEVEVEQHGRLVTIRPAPELSNRQLIEELRRMGMPSDGVQEREPFEYPVRPGL